MLLCSKCSAAMRISPLHRSRSGAYLPTSHRELLPCTKIARRHVKGETMTNPLVRTLRNWRKYRQTYNELVRLTDRELDDLGIRRVDIRSIARDSLAR